MSRSADPVDVATSRPIRPWLWGVAWVASAALAFDLGRVTAPSGESPRVVARSARNGLGDPTPPTRGVLTHPVATQPRTGVPSAAGVDPLDPAAQKQAEIIALLNKFKEGKLNDLGPELLGLIGWVNGANEDDLALFTALGKEVLTEDSMHSQLVLPLAFTRWTDLNAPAAFAAYLELEEGDRGSEIAKIVFGGWMRQGAPREAIDHALALQRTGGDAAPGGGGFVGDLLEDFVTSNRAEAGRIIDEFAHSNDPLEQKAATRAVDDFVNRLADDEDPASALEYINRWPDQEARAELRKDLMNHLLNGTIEQQRAGMELFAQMPSQDTGTVLSIARQKSAASISEAQSWMMTLPTGGARRAALDGILETLENQDKVEDIVPWLAARPPHVDFDSAYGRLAVSTFKNREDFPAAMQWAQRVVDPQSATQLKSKLIEHWLSIDQENAVRVLGPEMEKAMLASPR